MLDLYIRYVCMILGIIIVFLHDYYIFICI